MKETIFTGKKKEEGFKIYRRADMQKLLDSVDIGTELEIVIRKKKKKRSNRQNSYYHSIVIPIVLDGLIDAGYERKELNSEVVHEFLRKTFLKKVITNDSGEFIEVIHHTSELSTVEMMEYIADIQQWASEFLNIIIPNPNEQSNLDL